MKSPVVFADPPSWVITVNRSTVGRGSVGKGPGVPGGLEVGSGQNGQHINGEICSSVRRLAPSAPPVLTGHERCESEGKRYPLRFVQGSQ